MLNSLLHCDDLNINFGQNQVIKNLHMHLYEGEILSILGPSGCGKTTLLRIIAGLESPYQGTIFLNNEEIFGPDTNIEPAKRNIAVSYTHLTLPTSDLV